MSYVIPKLLCNSCPCQEGGDNSPRPFKRWRQTDGERGRKEGEVFSLMNRSGPEIYSRTVNLSEEVWLSLCERSLLLLITPVDVIIFINNVWRVFD